MKHCQIVHIGFDESLDELLDGLNVNVHLRLGRNFGINYTGAPKSRRKKKAVYVYSHGGLALSFSPFSCPWDSWTAGYVQGASEGVLSLIQAYCNNDHCGIIDESDDADGFQGTLQECLDEAARLGLTPRD